MNCKPTRSVPILECGSYPAEGRCDALSYQPSSNCENIATCWTDMKVGDYFYRIRVCQKHHLCDYVFPEKCVLCKGTGYVKKDGNRYTPCDRIEGELKEKKDGGKE